MRIKIGTTIKVEGMPYLLADSGQGWGLLVGLNSGTCCLDSLDLTYTPGWGTWVDKGHLDYKMRTVQGLHWNEESDSYEWMGFTKE